MVVCYQGYDLELFSLICTSIVGTLDVLFVYASKKKIQCFKHRLQFLSSIILPKQTTLFIDIVPTQQLSTHVSSPSACDVATLTGASLRASSSYRSARGGGTEGRGGKGRRVMGEVQYFIKESIS